MRKKYLAISALAVTLGLQAQNIDFGNFSGSLESGGQWYQDDENIGFSVDDPQFRSNNYFRLDYTQGKISAGLQYEAYLDKALLGYSDKLEGNGIATFYARYKGEKLDITAGNYYGQFGSGLIWRSWEDRQIGINNSLKGLRVKYSPTENTTLTGIVGKQRRGFELTSGTVQGIDIETNLLKIFNKNSSETLTAGLSYVGRTEEYSGSGDQVPNAVPNYSARLNYFGKSGITAGVEYVKKGHDVLMINGAPSQRLYDGKGYMFNLGYSRKGFGFNSVFRRLENMGMYSERVLSESAVNQYNEGNINYIPALTKQHDYLLTNIYVYQAQPNLNFLTQQVGEIGGQLDLFYKLKKGSLLGGKYGTKLAFNASYWSGIKATFNGDGTYDSDLFGFGKKFFHDVNMEISKKWNKKFSTIFTYANMYYHRGTIEGGNGTGVVSNVVVGDFLYKLDRKNSLRLEMQHLQSKRDKKNWAAAVLEYNRNYAWSFYLTDMYNYGNDDNDAQYHYYTAGASYSKNATRLSLEYGRQRGGLICVGGVCRYVPENTGLRFTLQHSF